MKCECFRPKTIEEALAYLHEQGENALIVNGATDVMPKLHDGVLREANWMFLYDLALHYVTYTDTDIRIGACVSQNTLLEEGRLERRIPLLSEAIRHMSGVSVRNAATLSGNLCNASPASDSAPALLALEATVIARSSEGEREIPLHDFFIGPGRNCLTPEELLTEIRIPDQRGKGMFFKNGQRKAEAISVVNGAVLLEKDPDGLCVKARIAFGSVGPTPCRAKRAEAALEGRRLTPELCLEAARIALQDISPISDIRSGAWYRSRIAENMTRRCVMQLAGFALEQE